MYVVQRLFCYYRKYLLLLLSIGLISTHAICGSKGEQRQDVLVLTSGWSPLLGQYFRAVTNMAIQHLQKNGDNYTVKYPNASNSIFRELKIATDKGDLYIDFSANRPTLAHKPGLIIPQQRINYQLPLLKGILGLRKLIINKDKQRYFSDINAKAHFLSLSTGQASHWPEVSIFENAGITVKKSLAYDTLFPMLNNQRFDYLHLGIIEIEEALEQQSKYSKQLIIADDIYVFYYIPIYVNVLKEYQKESQKVISSFEAIIENGELDKIFDAYFKGYIKQIDPHAAKVFFVNNHSVSQHLNDEMKSKVRHLYFDKKTKFFELGVKKR